jgi:hypothetical protein
MSETDHVMVARANALEKALSSSLPDAVFEVVRHNDWAAGFDAAYRIPLEEIQVKGSPAELEEWRRKSLRLRNNAYAVGDAALRHDGSYDKVRAQFLSMNPGFSDGSYESAIRFGYQQAR